MVLQGLLGLLKDQGQIPIKIPAIELKQWTDQTDQITTDNTALIILTISSYVVKIQDSKKLY